MPLRCLTDQAERLISLGVHHLAGLPDDAMRTVARRLEDAPSDPAGAAEERLLVTSAPASALAPLLRLGDRPGFVVEDMGDLDDFRPTVTVPATPYAVCGPDRGDAFRNRTPADSSPEIVAAGRSPLTIEEGLHWVLQHPGVLTRNACFMTIGSRLRRADATYDARTPALWISNGTGRDGPERRHAPKVGWCWWGNRHTWLGMASCAHRRGEARLTSWRRISRHGISTCGQGVHALRLLDMVSAATHAHLVVRRHVDLMRTRSMICWPR